MTISSVNAITSFTSDMLQENFGLTSVEAGNCFGYIYMVSGGSLVLTGFFCDKFGHLGLVQVVGAIGALTANLWWAFHSKNCLLTNDCGAVVMTPLILMGVAYG